MPGRSRLSRWLIALCSIVCGGCAPSPPTQSRVEVLVARPDVVQRVLTGTVDEHDCAEFRRRSDWLEPAVAAGWLEFRCESGRPIVRLTQAGRQVSTRWRARTWPDGVSGFDITVARWVFGDMTIDQVGKRATVRYSGAFQRTADGEVFGLPTRREVKDTIELRHLDGAWSPAAKGGDYIFH